MMGEVTRSYRLHLPRNYNPNNEVAVALVLDYHGWGGNAQWQEKDSKFVGNEIYDTRTKGRMTYGRITYGRITKR